jgi:Cell division protein CrgA
VPSSSSKKQNRKRVGRYVSPEERGLVTKRPAKSNKDHSPHWWGVSILQLLAFGMIVLTLNYLQVLPGSTSSWYLGLGLVSLMAAFYMATVYR